jgi:hypothetical protein
MRALVHGHPCLTGRTRAVQCTVSAEGRAAGQHTAGGQDHHPDAEQEPQARHRPQKEPFPHVLKIAPVH